MTSMTWFNRMWWHLTSSFSEVTSLPWTLSPTLLGQNSARAQNLAVDCYVGHVHIVHVYICLLLIVMDMSCICQGISRSPTSMVLRRGLNATPVVLKSAFVGTPSKVFAKMHLASSVHFHALRNNWQLPNPLVSVIYRIPFFPGDFLHLTSWSLYKMCPGVLHRRNCSTRLMSTLPGLY